MSAHGGKVSRNLDALLRERFSFAKSRIPAGSKVLEVGAGRGLTPRYLDGLSFVLTDVTRNDWLDVVASGDYLPFRDASFDAVLLIAVLHHMEFPLRGLDEALRVVRPGGQIFVLEPHGSWFLRAMLGITKHEYFDAGVDPYSDLSCKSAKGDPQWGNNAIGDLIFADPLRFKQRYPQLTVEHWKMAECFSFMNSGGVNIAVPYIPLPSAVVRWLIGADRVLARRWPDVFAMVQEIVLRRSQSMAEVGRPA